jgi:hypothetical protein
MAKGDRHKKQQLIPLPTAKKPDPTQAKRNNEMNCNQSESKPESRIYIGQ